MSSNLTHCPHCTKPIPSGCTVTCGRSECQEQSYRECMERNRRGRRVREVPKRQ